MRAFARRAIFAFGLLAVAFTAGGVTWMLQGGDDNASSEQIWNAGEFTIEEAQAFDEFEIYWLSEEFTGHELRQILREEYDPPPPAPDVVRTNAVTFVYGHCTPAPGQEGCAIPITIHINEYCTRPPDLIAASAAAAQTLVRGALASNTGAKSMSIWTGRSQIDIQLTSAAPSLEDVVNALRSVDPSGLGPGGDFPPVAVDQC